MHATLLSFPHHLALYGESVSYSILCFRTAVRLLVGSDLRVTRVLASTQLDALSLVLLIFLQTLLAKSKMCLQSMPSYSRYFHHLFALTASAKLTLLPPAQPL